MPFVADPSEKQSRFTPDAMDETAAAESAPANSEPVASNHGLAADVVAGGNRGISGLLGLPVDTAMNLWDLGKAGVGYAQSKFTGHAPSPMFDPSDRSQVAGSSAWLDQMAKKYAGIDTANPDPQSGMGRYAYAAGTAIPSALMAQPETMGQTASAIGSNVVPALAGQAAADKFPNSRVAPILASLAAQTVPTAIHAAADMIPRPAEEVTPAAQTLMDAGVTLDKGQRTGSDNWAQVRRWVNDNPFTQPGQKRFSDEQLGQFNQALVSAMGEDAKAATPEVMENARKRIGSYYEAVNERVPITIDPKLGADVQQTMQEARDVLPQEQYDQLQKQMDNVQLKGQYGEITFKQWQPVKKALDNMVAAGDTRAQFAKQLRGSFGDALTRSATGTDAQLLQDANRQWQALKQIQQAVPSDGTGIITPARMAQVLHTQRNQYQSVYGRGNQDLVDLAHAGKQVLTEKAPNSGTAYRAGLQFLADNPVSTILGTRGALPLLGQRFLNAQPTVPGASLGPNPGRVLSYATQDALLANRPDDVPGFAKGGAVDTDALAKLSAHYAPGRRGGRRASKPVSADPDPNPLAGALPDLFGGNPSEVPGVAGAQPPPHDDGIASITDAMSPYFEGFAEGGQVDAPYDYHADLKHLQRFDDGGRVGDPFSMDWYNSYGEGPEYQWTQPAVSYGAPMTQGPTTTAAPPTTTAAPQQQTGIPLNQLNQYGKAVGKTVSNNLPVNLSTLPSTSADLSALTAANQAGMGEQLAANGLGNTATTLGMNADLGGSLGDLTDAGVQAGMGATAAQGADELAGTALPSMPAVAGSGLSGLGSAAGTALGGLAAGYGLYNAVDNWESGDTGGDALRGAEAGAAIGSVVPVVGTLVGGLAGGAIGALSSAFGGGKQSVADQDWRAFNKLNGNVNPASISPTDMQHIWGGGYTSNETGALKQLNAALAGTYGNQNSSDGQAWNYENFVKQAVNQAAAGGQNLSGLTPAQLYSQVVQPYTASVYGDTVANSVPKGFANVVGTQAAQDAAALANGQTVSPAFKYGTGVTNPNMPAASTGALNVNQLQLARGALHMASGGGVRLPRLGALSGLHALMQHGVGGLSAGIRRDSPMSQFTHGLTRSMSLNRPLFKAGSIKQF